MKSFSTLLIRLSLALIFVVSCYSRCNAVNQVETKQMQFENDTNKSLLDSLNIDSIYIDKGLEEFFIKGNKIIVKPSGKHSFEYEISQNAVDSLIMPLVALYVDKTVPVRVGRKKLDGYWCQDVKLYAIKIFTPDKMIKIIDKYPSKDWNYEIYYSEEVDKLKTYLYRLTKNL